MVRRLLLLLAGTANALQRPAAPRRTLVTRQAHEPKQYQIIAGPACEAMAQRIQASEPARFTYHETSWDKFPDGTDRIVVGGFQPKNEISNYCLSFLLALIALCFLFLFTLLCNTEFQLHERVSTRHAKGASG